MDRQGYVVLSVIDGEDGYMATYAPQMATIDEFDSPEAAAVFNVGSYPDADARGKPYRVIVIPAEHWQEFEVFAEATHGTRSFRAYPSGEPTLAR